MLAQPRRGGSILGVQPWSRFFLLFLALLMSSLFSTLFHFDRAFGGNGFEGHLLEAIEVNSQRKPLYSKLTGGASESISRKLIRTEKYLLPFARILDRRSQFYRQYGIPVLINEFVSMDAISRMQEFPDPVREMPTALLREYSGWGLLGRFLSQRNRSLEEIGEVAGEELKILEAAPSFFCMARHFLESIRRVAHYGVIHEQEASVRKVSSPVKITKRVLLLHYFGLPFAVSLDRSAAPIQAQGVSIICNDVPSIGLD